ncbi:MAG: hypothetical protein ACRC7N_16645 [Clostridium sp.]
MKKKVLSVLLVTGIILSGSTISNAASKSVSINGSQTGASSSIAYINADTGYTKSCTNQKTAQNRKLWVEVTRVVQWGADKVESSHVVAPGGNGFFGNLQVPVSANYYLHLDPNGYGQTGCVGSGSFSW